MQDTWLLPPRRQGSNFLNAINKFTEILTKYNYIHDRNYAWKELKECLLLFSSEFVFFSFNITNTVKNYFISIYYLITWGTLWRSWLRHCATSQKVLGSIPAGVMVIFYWHYPSGRVLVLESTQPLTEMSTRNISWGYRWPVNKADNLTTFMCGLYWNLGASSFRDPQGLSRPVGGLLYRYQIM
jgi:hypothetical protein